MDQIVKHLMWLLKIVAHFPVPENLQRDFIKGQLDTYAGTVESEWKDKYLNVVNLYHDLDAKTREYTRQWEYAVAYHATRSNWDTYMHQLITNSYRPSKIGLIKTVRYDLQRPDSLTFGLRPVKEAVEKVLESQAYADLLNHAINEWEAKQQDKKIADLREKLTGTPECNDE